MFAAYVLNKQSSSVLFFAFVRNDSVLFFTSLYLDAKTFSIWGEWSVLELSKL